MAGALRIVRQYFAGPPGFEPGTVVLETTIIPFNYRPKLGRIGDLRTTTVLCPHSFINHINFLDYVKKTPPHRLASYAGSKSKLWLFLGQLLLAIFLLDFLQGNGRNPFTSPEKRASSFRATVERVDLWVFCVARMRKLRLFGW